MHLIIILTLITVTGCLSIFGGIQMMNLSRPIMVGRSIAARLRVVVTPCLAILSVAMTSAATYAAEVNIYSHRQQFLLQPFLDAFTAETGISTRVVYASKGLAQRLLAEGETSPADVILTVDIARLGEYADLDLLAPVESSVLATNIPAHMRAADNRWFALSTRARLVATSVDRVDEGAIRDIEDLAHPQWKGRVCSRKGSHVYNRSLMASVIAANGADAAEAWANGLVANFARRPQGNDRAQIKAVAQGECDIAIGNTYYYGIMLSDPEQRPAAEAVRPVFPNQDGRGAHMNITGAGVTKHAKHPENGVKLIEYLTSARAQEIYAAQNFEFPVVAGVAIDPVIAVFGEFKEDSVSLADVAAQRRAAAQMVDRAGLSS